MSSREAWFRACLQQIGGMPGRPRSIAFPYQVGCGMAGGSWPAYEAMLLAFACEHPEVDVVVAARASDLMGRDAADFVEA